MPPKAEKKICMVPACEASSIDYPDRIFVSVPENKKREWLAMVGAESVYIHPTKRFFCCEEHFDVRRDIKDYDFFKLFGGRVKFEDHAYPFKNLGDVPEVIPPTIVTDGKRNTTDIYFPAPLPVTVVEEQPIAESELKDKTESNLWKEQRDDEEEIVFVDPLLTADEPLEPIASNVKVDDEDESMFDDSESKYDPDQMTWTESPVKQEEIVIKPELHIKDEPSKESRETDGSCSENDIGDMGDDDDDYDEVDEEDDDEDFSPDSSSKTSNRNKEDNKSESNLDEDSNSSESDGYVPKNTNHKCLKCNKYCASSSSLKRHEQTVHTEEKDKLRNEKRLKSKPKPKPFKCDVCRKPFETLFRKNRHQVTHDEGRVRIIACRQCPERFTEYEEYQRHKVVHVKSFECDVCHKTFSTKYFLKLHYPIHMETKPFQCDRCSRSFSQASTLRRHIYLHEAEKKFMCELCGKRFHAQYLVKMHILHTHTEYRKYICSQCPKRFSSTTDLTIHTNVHHSEVNPYKCETCDKTFTHPSALRRHHRKVHTGFGEFVCQHCNKRFVRADLMDKHINTVHTLKSIKCELCPATFTTAVKLKKHARVHREPPVRPAAIVHRCMECHQPFNDQEKLARHLEMSHNPNNPFKCDVCLKRLSSQSALCRHMKLLHTMQTKSYKCNECGKSFGRLEHFKNHTLMLHNPANEFKCSTCRQTYSTKQSLDKHITRVHETERTMLCQYCNKAFSKRYILQRHIRNFHDIESGISSGISYNMMVHQIDK